LGNRELNVFVLKQYNTNSVQEKLIGGRQLSLCIKLFVLIAFVHLIIGVNAIYIVITF
jgi:hypothetical protein